MTLGVTRRRTGELPAEVTGFIGRRAELSQLAGLLDTTRLVTVTGPGGVGKTRVSLRAAAQAAAGFRDGVCLVELSGLSDAGLVPHTVAAGLGLPQSDSQLDAVLDFLHERELLIILDTCEHLLDACAMLADAVLRAAPNVTVLATSRQPLDVPGEHICAIAPLPVPDPDVPTPGAADGDAVELFAQRAAAVVAGFTIDAANRADVIRVCRRMDGIPLAIELATVRLRALPLTELADRLESRFRVLTGGLQTSLSRHKTLWTAIEWSHDLCTPAERLLWARLSVFAGSFNVEAAEDVCADDILDRDEIVTALVALVDKSVLLREEREEREELEEQAGSARYRLLDTLREFGAEQLAGWGEEAEFQTRHIAHYLEMADYFEAHLIDDDQLRRFRALAREHPNIRAALEYALALPGRDGDAARLATALGAYWQISGRVEEGKYWLIRILDRFPDPSPERASALTARSRLHVDADLEGRQGIAMAERFGDKLLAARGYLYLLETYCLTGQIDEARRAGAIADERLRALKDPIGLFFLDSLMCQMYALAGESALALVHSARGLRRAAGRGEVWGTSNMHCMRGLALFQLGKYTESAEAQYTALTMLTELGDILGKAQCLEMLSWLAVSQLRHDRAAWLLGAADGAYSLAGQHIGLYGALTGPHQLAETACRAALGESGYDALYRAGIEYPLDQLVPVVTSDADKLPQARPEKVGADKADPLTTREREIAALVAEGLSNRKIADRLIVSKRTVDAHVEHIYVKLGITSRVELTNWLKP